ncbi:MAG: 4-hydroxybenzoate octaprenyltransferase [Deltaproteobacteria bacterium CG11_big_fil_rev_8_21_14_0_20_47_16]|nr:MAG: 4-hydroxybenzoate octaprenyltransferase [Deltaproteobacteria bacterium CG11_big_fil_rev_8_21_14_0_20_47_16]
MLQKIKHTLELVRFSHSIFALPFALGSMVIAADGFPQQLLILKIIIAMVAARTMSMAFNRWIDADIDSKNPRTASRHIPAGILSKRYVIGLTFLMLVIFELVCLWINPLVFQLSPIALAVLLGYSLCKRFTSLSHFVLGLALGISPVGAWIAVTGQFSWIPVLLCVAIVIWVGGFDIIYALQDEAFDRQSGLHSMVVRLGRKRAVILACFLQLGMLFPLAQFGLQTGLKGPYNGFLGVILAIQLIMCILVIQLYIRKRLTPSPKLGNLLLMLNGLTGVAFLLACLFGI